MAAPLNDTAFDTLFRDARSFNGWLDKPVSENTLRALYDLVKWGPTSANCSPARFHFVVSQEAREKLKPHLMDQNVDKVMTAGVCVIIGYDMDFAEQLPKLFPHNPDAKNWFGDETVAFQTAFRNGSLQGAYLMLAARSLGLDCGPMSGFDNAAVDAAFFAGTAIKSNFICSLGYGDPASLFDRSPRLAFDEACAIL